ARRGIALWRVAGVRGRVVRCPAEGRLAARLAYHRARAVDAAGVVLPVAGDGVAGFLRGTVRRQRAADRRAGAGPRRRGVPGTGLPQRAAGPALGVEVSDDRLGRAVRL